MCVIAVLCAASPAFSAGLYEASTIVTGMDMRGRPEAVARTLAQVLAKVSGNPALLLDARVAALDTAPLVLGFAYLDRMSDQPKRDEQGTRDRPYDLVVQFRAGAIDDLLRAWKEAPWPEPRPALAVDIRIEPRTGPAMALRADTDADERHRAALLGAAERFGVALVLPAALNGPPAPADSPVLSGSLVWSDAATGWISAWRLSWRGVDHAWGQRGVGFDAAYRDALAGTVRVLSGH